MLQLPCPCYLTLSPKWTTEAEILADQHFYLPPEWPAVCTEGRKKNPSLDLLIKRPLAKDFLRRFWKKRKETCKSNTRIIIIFVPLACLGQVCVGPQQAHVQLHLAHLRAKISSCTPTQGLLLYSYLFGCLTGAVVRWKEQESRTKEERNSLRVSASKALLQ